MHCEDLERERERPITKATALHPLGLCLASPPPLPLSSSARLLADSCGRNREALVVAATRPPSHISR